MTHLVTYDLINADAGEHTRMRTEVMEGINGAERLLRSVWTVPTNNRTSTQIARSVLDAASNAHIKADRLRVVACEYTNPIRKRRDLRDSD